VNNTCTNQLMRESIRIQVLCPFGLYAIQSLGFISHMHL
jgi:hypothetical protein